MRFLPVLFSLVPVFPPLYLLAFAALRGFFALPRWARQALYFFLFTQGAAALFTERPLLSFSLALLRGLFIAALVTLGYRLKEERWLGYLLYGYMAVGLLALVWSAHFLGPRLLSARLIHPYYTTVSLGLVGALLVMLAVGVPGLPRWSRVLGGAVGLAVLGLSGSRGPLFALLVGASMAALLGGRAYLKALAAGGGVLGLALLAFEGGKKIHALTRLLNPAHLSGRDKVWEGAIAAFHAHPLGGSGPYQLGPYLEHLYRTGCHLWVGAEKLGLRCPGWLEPFRGAWLIAHNLVLHALAETGLIGGAGWLFLYGWAAVVAWRARAPLLVAIVFGFLAMGLVDNPTLVPSLSLAEVFWVAVGMALSRSAQKAPRG